MRLQYQEKNILMTGRESIRVEVRELKTVLQGTLESIGTWRSGAWTIDMGKVGR